MGYILHAGELTERVDLMRVTSVDDGYASTEGPPDLLMTVWAKMRPAPGAERLASAEAAATAPRVFTIRYQAALSPDKPGGLTPRDVLRYPPTTGRLWDIKAVTPFGPRVAIEIAAVARVDQ